MQLSKNFWPSEFLKSQTAERLGIPNTPTPTHIAAMKALVESVLQRVRDQFGPVVCEWIQKNLVFDQLILEGHNPSLGPNSGWIHVSYRANGNNRKQVLTATFVNGKAQYSSGINA